MYVSTVSVRAISERISILSNEGLKPLIEKWNAMAPMGRMGKPEELQAIVVYLAGDCSTFTTGSDFVVDGAFTCI